MGYWKQIGRSDGVMWSSNFGDFYRQVYFPQVKPVAAMQQGKFVLKIIVGWADSFIVCPRRLITAWAQKRAHIY